MAGPFETKGRAKAWRQTEALAYPPKRRPTPAEVDAKFTAWATAHNSSLH